MLEKLFSDLNPTYSDAVINHLILSMSLILGGAFLLNYLVKIIKNDLTLSFGTSDYRLDKANLQRLLIVLGGIVCTFLALALMDGIFKQYNDYVKALVILVSLATFSQVWKKRIAV